MNDTSKKKKEKKIISKVVQKDNSLLVTYDDQTQLLKLTTGEILLICPMCGERNDIKQEYCQGNLLSGDDAKGKEKVLCKTLLDNEITEGGWINYGKKQ